MSHVELRRAKGRVSKFNRGPSPDRRALSCDTPTLSKPATPLQSEPKTRSAEGFLSAVGIWKFLALVILAFLFCGHTKHIEQLREAFFGYLLDCRFHIHMP